MCKYAHLPIYKNMSRCLFFTQTKYRQHNYSRGDMDTLRFFKSLNMRSNDFCEQP